jgi:para-aminobenzoate synthetase component 1
MATRGADEAAPFDHTLAVTARPYTHRLKAVGSEGLRLAVYPHPRQTPLAAHKTCNYLYYLLAGRWARKNAADEALILNPDATISETNSANLLQVRGNRAIVPASAHVLPGIMQRSVLRLLEEWGYEVEECALTPADLEAGDLLVATNSLMGAAPVFSVDGLALAPAGELCRRINRELLGTPQSG